MQYFPPKTKIDFHFGQPRSRNTWRHHYYVALGHADGKWYYSIWGGKNFEYNVKEIGFFSEEKAAEELTKHVAKMQFALLKPYYEKLVSETENVRKLMLDLESIC